MIALASSDQEIASCFDVLRQLRPALDRSTFVSDVLRMQKNGYLLAALRDGEVAAVAGYRYLDMFATGMTLYVDDLVTDAARRSAGYGTRLLGWLVNEARAHGCRFLTLDSGLKRIDAHRFYRREGLEEIALHFAIATDGGPMWTSD